MSYLFAACLANQPQNYQANLLTGADFQEFYADELPQFIELAAAGDSEAQYRLGRTLAEGWAASLGHEISLATLLSRVKTLQPSLRARAQLARQALMHLDLRKSVDPCKNKAVHRFCASPMG